MNDGLLVQSMSHEYSLLSQSYNEFLYFVLQNTERNDELVKLHLYNSYAKLLHHLYEFLKSCVAREISKTKSEDNDFVKRYIVSELCKIAKNRGENHHKKESFVQFADDLRIYRNKVYGHVMRERFDKYPLGQFFSKYHAYIVWLLQSTKPSWSSDISKLTNHDAIQEFSEIALLSKRVV